MKYETPLYEIIVGETGEWDSPCKGFPVYKLKNKLTGLIEGEGINFVDAIGTMLQRNSDLSDMLNAYDMSKVDLPEVH